MNTSKWTLYKPTDADENVLYLRNEKGADWYASQSDFSSKRMKVVYDDSGIIRAFSCDASELFPLDQYVTELARKPANLAIDGRWMFDGEKAVEIQLSTEELQEVAEKAKAALSRTAIEAMAPLEFAVELDIATEEEVALLSAWKKYRVLLNRVDTSQPDKIIWPSPPNS